MSEARVAGLLARGSRGVARRLAIARHAENGLLEVVSGSLRLTARGRLLASEVAIDLL
jgi:hypothetical protein